jgi:hypothetical protein
MRVHLPPNIHPYERLLAPSGQQVDIDAAMVPLVRTLWLKGLMTEASCQDLGEATAGLRNLEEHLPRYGGDGFIAFYQGYAWLKMPRAHGQKFLNALVGTAFHDRAVTRWQAGSWRLHVPVVYYEERGFDLAQAMQICFPREQLDGLTTVLAELSFP